MYVFTFLPLQKEFRWRLLSCHLSIVFGTPAAFFLGFKVQEILPMETLIWSQNSVWSPPPLCVRKIIQHAMKLNFIFLRTNAIFHCVCSTWPKNGPIIMVIRVSIFQAIFLFFLQKSGAWNEWFRTVKFDNNGIRNLFFFYFGYHKTVKLTLVI